MTPNDLITVYPEFAGDDPARIQLFIDMAAPYFDPVRWGDYLNEGQMCFVAHRIAVAAQTQNDTTHASATGSPILRRKVGDVEAQSSEQILVKSMDNPYLLTSYGRRYWQLVQQVGTGMVAVA